jgi:hypothetical protein
MPPYQFTTADGTLLGTVDGKNRNYTFAPFPDTVQYSVPGATGNLLFRNGVLLDNLTDYSEGPNYFTLLSPTPGNTITARVFTGPEPGPGPTKIRLKTGINTLGSATLWLAPTGPSYTTLVPFMLFRNGLLLTNGLDYNVSGPWIFLTGSNEISPPGGAALVGKGLPGSILPGFNPVDIYVTLISMLGSACSTFDGSIYGAVNGVNPTFYLPPSTQAMVFLNGRLLTQGVDYTVSQLATPIILPGANAATPNQSDLNANVPGYNIGDLVFQYGVTLLHPPMVGDTLTAQTWAASGPLQITNFDGSLALATAVESLLFANGDLETQTIDGYAEANAAYLAMAAPPGSTVTVEAWVPNITDAAEPAFNLPQQFSTVDGSLIGLTNGTNNVFTLATGSLVTQILLWWNRNFLQQGSQFTWTCVQNSSAGPWVTTVTLVGGNIPAPGDTVTCQIFEA